MKQNKILILIIAIAFVLFAAYIWYNKAYNKIKYGSLTIDAVIYEDADMGISDIIEVQLSKIYYRNNLMLERNIQDDGTEQFCLIKDKVFSGYFQSLDSLYFKEKIDVYLKKYGLVYFGDSLPNYANRIMMTDTVLDKVHFRRFAINTEIEYSVFYLCEKINLPYTFNAIAEKDYKGTIKRIDTYDRVNDRFISLKLNHSDSIPLKYFNKLKTF